MWGQRSASSCKGRAGSPLGLGRESGLLPPMLPLGPQMAVTSQPHGNPRPLLLPAEALALSVMKKVGEKLASSKLIQISV